jgi:parvulin-like peptidyl-prolyl isomerase
MKPVKLIQALGAFFVLATGLSACGGGIPGDSVAVVSGNPITTQAYKHWLYIAAKGQASQSPGSPVILPDPPSYTHCIATARTIPQLTGTPAATLKADCAQVFTQLNEQVLGFLIQAYWYQALAHTEGVTVSQASVMKVFNTAKKQQFPTDAGFQAFLKQSGETMADVVYRFKAQQIFKALVDHAASKTTPKTIAAYYNQHKAQFGTPQTLNMRIILAKTAAQANVAKAALQHGATWKATAAQYSTDASTKGNGGQLVGVTPGQQDAALGTAAFAAPVQTLEGPVKGQFGYYIFKVTKSTPAVQETLAQATAQIKTVLASTQQQNAQTEVTNKAKKAYGSDTLCRSLYSIAQCHGYKAPKTPTTPAVTPTPSTTPTVTATTPPPTSTTSTTSTSKKK